MIIIIIVIFPIQMIHTLHNLAIALEEHGAGVPHTLRDSTLKEEVVGLEEYYLKKAENQVCYKDIVRDFISCFVHHVRVDYERLLSVL